MTKERIIYYDLLNVVATLCVIAMHCNGIVHTYSNTLDWKQSLIIEVIAYWAVPVFFMLSGATLLEYRKRYTTTMFFKKRIQKTVIPFIIWSMIACLNLIHIGSLQISDMTVFSFISKIIYTSFENVYWFFIPLFAVYMAIPVLSYLCRETNLYLKYMFICGFITISVLPFLQAANLFSFNSEFTFPLTSGYLLLVILGYLLSTVTLSPKHRYLIYFLGLLGAVSRYLGTYFLSSEEAGVNHLFWGYYNWPSILLATAIFVWFKYHDWKHLTSNKRLCDVISSLAGASFGVYLIHMFVLRRLQNLYVLDTSLKNWLWRLIGPIIIYTVSVTLILLIKKIPILRNIVP